MAAHEWHEGDHPRDEAGRFVSGGAIWYVDQQLAAHSRQHVSEQRAIEVAADTIKVWKADSNEWRGTLADRDRTLAKASDLDAARDRIANLERLEITRAERERSRLVTEAEEKRQDERRQSFRFQVIGLVLGVPAVLGTVLGLLALSK